MTEPQRRRTILVVDDEAAIRELLKLQLGAARLVREAKPDLMIVDAHMPYVSGLDFVSAVITDSSMPWVPVIFITGRSELRNDAEALGSACLVKPFLGSRLLELIERVVRSQERLYAAAGLVERRAASAA